MILIDIPQKQETWFQDKLLSFLCNITSFQMKQRKFYFSGPSHHFCYSEQQHQAQEKPAALLDNWTCSSNDNKTFMTKAKNCPLSWTPKKSPRKWHPVSLCSRQWYEEIRMDWLSEPGSNSKFKSLWKWKA